MFREMFREIYSFKWVVGLKQKIHYSSETSLASSSWDTERGLRENPHSVFHWHILSCTDRVLWKKVSIFRLGYFKILKFTRFKQRDLHSWVEEKWHFKKLTLKTSKFVKQMNGSTFPLTSSFPAFETGTYT